MTGIFAVNRSSESNNMVLLYWAGIGIVLGLLAHVFLRSRGEEGYHIVGEALLGCVGAMTSAMVLGVIFGWRHIDLPSGIAAGIGAALVLGVMLYFTLKASARQHVVVRTGSGPT